MAVFIWMLLFSLLFKDAVNYRLKREMEKGVLEVAVAQNDHGSKDEKRFFFNWLTIPNMTGAIIDVSLGPIKFNTNIGDVGKEPTPEPPNIGAQCFTNSTVGTCFTQDKCTTIQGTALESDYCSDGLKCCTFNKTECGARYDKPYSMMWISPANPTTPQDCKLTIATSTMKSENGTNICRLRVDYKKSMLSSPDVVTGKCDEQKVTYQGTKSPVPEICGTNDGQHVYVEPSGDVVITTVGFREFGEWKILVTPIPCDSPDLPPADCLQYFNRPVDVVRSLGYQPTPLTTDSPTRQLSSMSYNMCFNKPDTCKLMLYTCKVLTDSLAFSVSGNSWDRTQAKSAVGKTECPDTGAYLTIPGTAIPDNRVCGNRFNSVAGQTVDGTIETTSNKITYVTPADLGTTGKGNLGFCLLSQIKC